MGVARSTTWLLALLAGSGAFAADVQRFVASQVHPQLPAITAYLDIVDVGGQPVSDLTPADFSAFLGAHSAQATGIKSFQSTGEGVAYAFLVDISKSIGAAQFAEMRDAIQASISNLKPADRAAIATFGEDYTLLTDFTADKHKLTSALEGLSPRDLHTRLYLAIDRAVELEQRVDPGLPFRRVIVVLSDGKDEGSALTSDDVLLKVRASRLPIYSIGLSHLPPPRKQRYLDVLNRLSSESGGLYREAGAESVTQSYAAIEQAILRVFVVRLACAGCPANGRSYPFEIALTHGTRGLKAAPLDLAALAGPAAPPAASVQTRWWSSTAFWRWLLAALVALAAAGFAVRRRKHASDSSLSPHEEMSPHEEGKLPFELANLANLFSAPKPEAKDGLPVKLTVVAGKDAGSSHELKLGSKAVIGRARDCDFAVPDPRVSDHHCELALIRGHVVVYDLGSTNNTYVNGVPLRGRRRLEPRDTILVGGTELRVHFEDV